MVETENASVILKNKLAEAECAISVLTDEKVAATGTIEKISQKLEDELEQKRTTVAQLDALRSEHTAMVSDLKSASIFEYILIFHSWIMTPYRRCGDF